jgi:hypothetical protein
LHFPFSSSVSSSLFASKPNVVLFLADDMGWMDSGVYGSTYYETPNIDRFAKRAMRFTNAYCAAVVLADPREHLERPIHRASWHHDGERTSAAATGGSSVFAGNSASERADAAAGEQKLPGAGADHAGGDFEERWIPHGSHRQVAPRAHAATLAGAAGF